MRSRGLADHAARTWAAREHGGSLAIKEFTKGGRGYFPVYVDGAHLSLGDLHFSRGDGKIAGLGAVKMAGGWIDLKVEVIPRGMERLSIHDVVLETAPVASPYGAGRSLVFEGISVMHPSGEQRLLDVHAAYERALMRAIEFLERFGYSREQAYVLLSALPVEGRLSCLLEHPNVCVTIAVPMSAFEFDVGPMPRSMTAPPLGSLSRPSESSPAA